MKKWLFFLLVIFAVLYLRRVGERGDNSAVPSNTNSCAVDAIDLERLLNAYAATIEAQPEKWMYSNKASDYRDCSGMFLRLCENMQDQVCNKFAFPDRSFHSTRDLASWYAKHGKLRLIWDPSANEQYIQVGQVMFYGKANKKIPNRFDLSSLTAPYPKGLLAHMGVVVSVNRDEETGKLESYTLYHGRSSGKAATRSIIRSSQNPDFGNWGQPWLGTASLLVRP